MENYILLSCCKENQAVFAAKYIALLDRNELNKEDLSWEEIEPYIRILGVRSRDLYENIPISRQDTAEIETKLLEKHEKICEILNTHEPLKKLKSLCENSKQTSKKIKILKQKQEKTLKICEENMKKIHNNLNNFSEPQASPSDFSLKFQELKNLSLKIQCIKQSLKSQLYTETSSKALKIIQSELFSTYDEYSSMKSLLLSQISVYENNPVLLGLLQKYLDLQKRIQKKKEDINSIS